MCGSGASCSAVERVSIDDDFFLDLGGHSLLAAQAVSTLRRDLGIARASVHDLYEYPTVRRLAAHLERRAVERDASESAVSTW